MHSSLMTDAQPPFLVQHESFECGPWISSIPQSFARRLALSGLHTHQFNFLIRISMGEAQESLLHKGSK